MLLPAISVLALLLLADYWLGRPSATSMEPLPTNDTYEKIDYRGGGRIEAPYLIWEEGWGTHFELPVAVRTEYRSRFFLSRLFVQDMVTVGVEPRFLPEDFLAVEVVDGVARHSVPLHRPIGATLSGGRFAFKFALVKRDAAPPREPCFFHFRVKVSFLGRRAFFFRPWFTEEHDLYFFVGPDLGSLWVALDPGTTGSCIATGSNSGNIYIEKDATGQEVITPSIVAIDKGTTQKINSPAKLAAAAKVGLAAERHAGGDPTHAVFQSIKKLLGYSDKFRLTLDNGFVTALDGQQMTQILVAHILKQLKTHVQKSPRLLAELASSGQGFQPMRAVVAIPNNFTATKTQDLVDSLNQSGAFKEVRSISEAEAVLCHYIHQHAALHPSKAEIKDETVLVFDMGGATINLTLADTFCKTNDGQKNYHIDVETKLGYAIGGDTIDYCLAKLIYGFAKQYPRLLDKGDPFLDLSQLPPTAAEPQRLLRRDVKKKVEFLKKEIVEKAADPTAKSFVPLSTLNSTFDNAFENMDDKAALYAYFLKEQGPDFFDHPEFQRHIVQPISDILDEAAQLGQLKHLNTVIFSGRSTLFPGIKELVQKKVSATKFHSRRRINFVSLKGGQLKTAVASGACWYAVNRSAVKLTLPKVFGNLGIKVSRGGAASEIDFCTIIPYGTNLKNGYVSRTIPMKDQFRFDNQQATFYQVMGAKPAQALRKGEKHKYSTLGAIRSQFEVTSATMAVFHNDLIIGEVRLSVGGDKRIEAVLKDQEAASANDEHYTWIIN